MNYQKIVASSKKSINEKERILQRIENHLEEHPKDYQTKIAYLLKQSQLVRERRQLSVLEYRAKIQKYTED